MLECQTFRPVLFEHSIVVVVPNSFVVGVGIYIQFHTTNNRINNYFLTNHSPKLIRTKFILSK